jgi:hypothetical protein
MVTEVWRLAVGVVVGIHFAFLGYVAVGGFLAWRWPRSIVVHVGTVAWGLASILAPVACPLTAAEDLLRRWAGEPPLPSGFVDQYVEGVLYPERFTPLVRGLIATAIAISWLRLGWRAVARAGGAAAPAAVSVRPPVA